MNDTIAAIATPAGEGGLAVIRLSGPQALTIIDHCFQSGRNDSALLSQAHSHTIHHGYMIDQDHRVDEVLVSIMRAPRTYTREDTVEISCHGGWLVTRRVLEIVLRQGARSAEPGEFTKRAFLNGRIDLTQAEAVLDVIKARTERALAAAADQLAGKLSERINHLRDDLLHALAHIEAHLDFPDEDIAPDSRSTIENRFCQARDFIEQLMQTAREGQILRTGIRAVILGRPNVGKSSLLNQLLGHDRAIVSPVAGTTRDTIEETADIRGLPIVFIDTAGLRPEGDALELEGMRRSRHSLERAELVLMVIDGSEPLTADDQSLLAESEGKPCIVVLNKADLSTRCEFPQHAPANLLRVSCRTSEGIEQLKNKIKELVWSGSILADNANLMINARHQEALYRARQGLDHALRTLRQNAPLELTALDLRIAVNAVGEIIGKTTTEDLLDAIFSQFCIGK